ncbi:MAG: hypothetical protein J5840_09400 [Lachnospiraceae bacterium]|nr:hypothetical protein [Lachnospiraceae bacterium]
MDDRISRILELERRIREERSELDSLAEITDIGDDYYIQNKLKYLQAEIEYLNSQCSLLSDMTTAKKSVASESGAVKETPVETQGIRTWVRDKVTYDEPVNAPETEVVSETVEPAKEEFVPVSIEPVSDEIKPTSVEPITEDIAVAEVEPAANESAFVSVTEDVSSSSVESAETIDTAAESVSETIEMAPIEETASEAFEEQLHDISLVEEEPIKEEETVAEEIDAAVEKSAFDKEYEVEQTIEIKSVPESVKTEGKKKKKASLENRIGLLVMPILAATLIFASVILLASALPESIGNVLKQITMFVAGFVFVGTGLFLHLKKKGGAFGQVLMAIGVGELFVSLAVCRFVFNSFNDLGLFIAIFIWSALLIILKRFANILFQVIGEIGVSVAVNFGVCYSLATGNHNGIFVILAFYALTGFIYYFLFKFKGSLANIIIFHAFNIINIIFMSTGALLGLDNGLLPCGILGALSVFFALLASIDIIVTFRSDSAVDQIFGAAVNFVYSVIVFATSFFSVSYLILSDLGFDKSALIDRFREIPAIVGETRWIAIAVPCALISLIILLVEFVWTEKIPKYASQATLLFVVLGALLCSHTSFKFGFVIAMFALTLFGYIRKNHVLKIASLLFYVIYAFIPGEDLMRIIAGLSMAILILTLLYAAKEQYLFAYKICVYFALILYAIMVSFSVFSTSSLYGIRAVVIIAFISLLNLLMMFTPLAKNKDKVFDIAIIPEIINIITVPAALVTAFAIKIDGSTIGYLPVLIAFIMIIVSIFRGYLQKRVVCRICSIVSLVFAVICLTPYDYSAFWFAIISIGLAIALMYIKKDSYSFIDKLCYFIIALGFAGTCVWYFVDELKIFTGTDTLLFLTWNKYSYYLLIEVWFIAATVLTLIFMFTGLSKTADKTRNDFEWVTFTTLGFLVLSAMAEMHYDIRARQNYYIPLAVICVITFVWLIHGFVAGKNKEKIAVLSTLYLMIPLSLSIYIETEYSIFASVVSVLFLLLLYIKKEDYKVFYKDAVFAYMLINCFFIPSSYSKQLDNLEFVKSTGIMLIAATAITLIYKFTIFSKNPDTKENDYHLRTFIAECLTAGIAAYFLAVFREDVNYVPSAILLILGIVWTLHGFISKKITEKIAFLILMFFIACLSWAYVPWIYVATAAILTVLFIALLYIKSESYSFVYKIAIYILTLANCIICPILFIDDLAQISWLGVGGTVLLALFVISLLFKFTSLAKNPDSEEDDFYWMTYGTLVAVGIYAMILMPVFEEVGNWVPAIVIALTLCVWLIHGFAAERISEKIAVISGAFLITTISMLFNPVMYVVISAAVIIVFLFLMYTQENAYSFIFKLLLFSLSLLNAIIWPLLFRETLAQLNILVLANAIFVLLFAVNTLFRFTPLVRNPETDQRDMRFISIAVSHALVLTGIGITFALEAPADVLSCVITLILIPIATAWAWTGEEDDNPVIWKYFAVVEYVFVPFILCYALEAPNYVSSIVGIVLAVGCIVLGFAMKMKGVRIYGLVISMIMIFKLSLIDFEKSSVVAYAVSFLIAGISCLIISMLYYFVNAAMADKE